MPRQNSKMERRAFLGLVGAAAAASALARPAFAAETKPTLVYLSAEDCPTCRGWEKTYEPGFKSSAEAKAVRFRTVMVHSLMNLREKGRWPADLEWLRVQAPKQATPRFFLIRDQKILARGDGVDGWTDVIVPRLKKLAGEG